ncbi:MAG: hypothetical protein RLZZ433_649 [Pseudomonadota bacterium]|jgi:uncharacterized membrane-anchored protein
MTEPSLFKLPADVASRSVLHNEIHTRPSANIELPALIFYVAVINANVTVQDELQHLQQLPSQSDLPIEKLRTNFCQLQFSTHTLIWERHTEFTRYTLIQKLPNEVLWGQTFPDLSPSVAVDSDWISSIPGRTITAIQLAILTQGMEDQNALRHAKLWLGDGPLIGSKMGRNSNGLPHSHLLSNLRIDEQGFERILVLASTETSPNRAGRIVQRILELETYRMMALLSLPVAKSLGSKLAHTEVQLVNITQRLERQIDADEILLKDLASLAVQVESATAEHSFRFSAARAYNAIVLERISEMRETPLSGIQTIGEFMQRRLAPAMATVNATSDRLGNLAERVSRASALLRTRVEILAEQQNQQLLEKLTRGQALQLRLQSTVEGLSIAAITYYVVSLALYVGKTMKVLGMNINPEVFAGMMIPFVLFFARKTIQKIHQQIIQ